MKLYGAIDLHSNNSFTVVLDEKDTVVYQKRLPNDIKIIREQLAPYRDQLQGIAVESTFNWYWLVDGLMDAGYKLHLVNTTAVQQYNGLKFTDDEHDARCSQDVSGHCPGRILGGGDTGAGRQHQPFVGQ